MVRNYSKLLAFVIFSSIFTSCVAQKPKPDKDFKTREAANASTDEGIKYLMEGNTKEAEKSLLNTIKKYPGNNADAWQALGECYNDMGNYAKAKSAFLKYKEIAEVSTDVDYRIGFAYYQMMNFDSSKYYFNQYKNNPQANAQRKKDAIAFLAKVDKVKYIVENPVAFKPVNLGPSVNTKNDEYFPGLSLDEKTLIFTRQINRNEDFYMSKTNDSVWQNATALTGVNTPANEGFVSLSADGNYIFYTACNRPDGEGSCDIYLSVYRNNVWGKPINLRAPINSESWESQPSVSSDGLTLYFSSGRPGGFGGTDIWKTVWDKQNNRFGFPINLGPTINTPLDEQAPFIHPDGITLYFSSEGHINLGGTDLFVAKADADGKFGEPENLGYPINTIGDERSIIIDRSGKYGYMSADREGGMGGMDIYRFVIPASIKPEQISYVSGTVYDAKTKERIEADIELTDLATGKVVTEAKSSKNGEFLVILESNKNYALTVDHTGYIFYSDNFLLKETSQLEPLKIEVPLDKPEAGTKFVLNNIFFDVDKFELRDESKGELNKLVSLLKKFPNMKIEVGGHTDNTGNKEKNATLSNNRALAVKNYLVANNIAGYRISYKGYGDSMPVKTNETDEGRAANRRTEFTVISN
ncbi:MAG: PD40 domain-containing protein [Bacteroidia bacterium]|nr:PD40 domain-containing protein [Bacteroidia bacterium]